MAVTSVGTPGQGRNAAASLSTAWGANQNRTAGNLLVAVVGAGGNTTQASAAISEGSGTWTKWVQVHDSSGNSSYATISLWTKEAAGGDAAPSFTSNFTGTTAMAYALFELNGANNDCPIDVCGTASDNGNVVSLTATCPGVTQGAGDFAIGAFARERAANTYTGTCSGSGFSNVYNDGGTSSVLHFAVDTNSSPGSGATVADTYAWSGTTTNSRWAAFTVCIAPAAYSHMVVTAQTLPTSDGYLAQLLVLTGATEAGGASAGNSTAAAPRSTITPNYSNSLPVFVIDDPTTNSTFTPDSSPSNAILTQNASADFLTAGCTGKYGGTVTQGQNITVGCQAPTTDTCTWAVYEVPPSGGSTPSSDSSQPSYVPSQYSDIYMGNQAVIGTDGMPPGGSVLVLLVSSDTTAGTPTCTVADSLGLTWTPRKTQTATGTGAFIYTATVPSAGPSPKSGAAAAAGAGQGTGAVRASVIVKNGGGSAKGSSAGNAARTIARAGGGAAAGAGAGTRRFGVRAYRGGGAAVPAGSGNQVKAGTVARSGAGAAAGTGSGSADRAVRNLRGGGSASGSGSASRALLRARTGAGAALAAGQGSGTAASAATASVDTVAVAVAYTPAGAQEYAKAGGGAAKGTGVGGPDRAVRNLRGGGMTAGAGNGAKAGIIPKAGAGAAAGAGSVVLDQAVRSRRGAGAAAGAGAGVPAVRSLTKSGGGAAVGSGSPVRAVALTRAGAGAGTCAGAGTGVKVTGAVYQRSGGGSARGCGTCPRPPGVWIDGSSPPIVNQADGGTSDPVTAQFSPPADSLILVLLNWLYDGNPSQPSYTPSNTGSNLAWGAPRKSQWQSSICVYSGTWCAYNPSPQTGITVTVHAGTANAGAAQLKVLVLTGAKEDQSGGGTASWSASGDTKEYAAITTHMAGSKVFAAAVGINGGTWTPYNNSITQIGTTLSAVSAGSSAVVGGSPATVTPGSPSIGWTIESCVTNGVSVEVLPGVTRRLKGSGAATAAASGTLDRGGQGRTGGGSARGAGTGQRALALARAGAGAARGGGTVVKTQTWYAKNGAGAVTAAGGGQRQRTQQAWGGGAAPGLGQGTEVHVTAGWVNAGYLDGTSQETNFATASPPQNVWYGDDFTTFDFSGLPDTAVVNSLTVTLRVKESGTANVRYRFGPRAGGAALATIRDTGDTAGSTSLHSVTYAGWDALPTAAQLKDPSFAIRCEFTRTSSTAVTGSLCYIGVVANITVSGSMGLSKYGGGGALGLGCGTVAVARTRSGAGAGPGAGTGVRTVSRARAGAGAGTGCGRGRVQTVRVLAVAQSAGAAPAQAVPVAFSLPHLPVPGNVLLAFIGYYATSTLTPPSGAWHQIFDFNGAANDNLACYWYLVQPGDGKDWSFPYNADYASGELFEVQGADTNDPVSNFQTGGFTATPVATPSSVPTDLGCLPFAAVTTDGNYTNTPSAGWTNLAEGGNWHSTATAYRDTLTGDLTTGISCTFALGDRGCVTTVLIAPKTGVTYALAGAGTTRGAGAGKASGTITRAAAGAAVGSGGGRGYNLMKAGGGMARAAGAGPGRIAGTGKSGGGAATAAGSGWRAGIRSAWGAGTARAAGTGLLTVPGPRTYEKKGAGLSIAAGTAQGYFTGWWRLVMADSLTIGDIELLGGGQPSTNPECAGAMFRLLPGYDPGAPQPTTDYVASLLLDGERPFGRRASNRTVKLPIWIIATDRDNLAAAREHLESAVDRDMYTVTWTRDRGDALDPLPLLIDCFRAEPTQVTSNLFWERHNCQQVEVTIPALPYARSDAQQVMAFASPVPAAPPPPPSPVLLDDFETISSPQCYRHTAHVVGPHSCCWDPDDQRVGDPGGMSSWFEYTRVFDNSKDLTSMTAVAMHIGLGTRYYHRLRYHGHHGPFDVTLTLLDTENNPLAFSRSHLHLPVSPSYAVPTFTHVAMRIPLNDPNFHYSSVGGYTLKVTNHHWVSHHYLRHVTLYVDELKAFPDSQTALPVTRGAVYTLFGLKGTARSAMSLQFQQPPSPGSPTTLSTTGPATYTVPGGTAWLKVEGIGGGGAGAGRTTAGMGGGGGGAEYAREDLFPAIAAEVIPYSIGVAGAQGASPTDGGATYFGPGSQSTLVLTANGGKSALQNSVTGGLGGTGSGNSVHHDGGKGRTATGSYGGGGGSSGGTSLPGNTPLGTGSVAWSTTTPSTTISTTWTCPAGVTQVYAECWGGAGSGGSASSAENGQGGGGGEYAAGYVPVTPGNSYNLVAGPGGAGVTGWSVDGNSGGNSSFTGDAGAAVLAHGGLRGLATTSSGTPWNGGSGSTNTVHHNGGSGGSANPYTGGGGSSGSPSATGNNGDGYAHGAVAPADGGAGGNGSGGYSTNGYAGSVPGGGGGGLWDSGYTSGAGGNGKVRLSYPGGSPDQYGAPAVTGGGAGGSGGATANSTGSAGSQPGGGGGGANSTGTAEAGGAGGTGKAIVTPYASQAWKSLIVHRPPRGTDKNFQPLVSVGAGNDTPNGTFWYNFPEPITGVKARLHGTYSVILINKTWDGSASRTVTVTFRQTEYSGGQSYSQAVPAVSFTPSQVTNGILRVGTITLPVRDIPADNTAAYFSVSVNDTDTADRFYDLILLDTMGQTLVCNEPSTGYLRYWIDAPDPNTLLGRVLGSQSDRTAAVSVLSDTPTISGGPLTVEPSDGENLLFAYCPDGQAPAIGVTYFPSWFFDRTS